MDFTLQDLLMIFPIRFIRTIVIVLLTIWLLPAVYGFISFVGGKKVKEFRFLGFNMKK